MPYFIKRLLDVHEDGRRVVSDISGTKGGLGKLKDFVVGGAVFSESRLLNVKYVVVICPRG